MFKVIFKQNRKGTFDKFSDVCLFCIGDNKIYLLCKTNLAYLASVILCAC